MQTVGSTIERDLADEPRSVIKVAETSGLRSELLEYVLTDRLARHFADALESLVQSARPAAAEAKGNCIWLSGFFGSGKSHFAKLAGHVLANTPVGDATARDLFRQLLHSGNAGDDRVAELLREAATYRLACHLVAFDITTLHTPGAEQNVGLTFLRALYSSLQLSNVIPFAERELELEEAGLYAAFLALYQQKAQTPWAEEKHLMLSSSLLAECLAELLPRRYSTPDLAHQSLELALNTFNNLTIDGAVDQLLHWLDRRQRTAGAAPLRLLFVADEVGGWAAGNIKRIEQVRAFVETLENKARGRVWVLATSQEKLSAVVSNAPFQDDGSAQRMLERLTARFRVNVHLESSEVGRVIEDRVLRKKPSARPALEALWTRCRPTLADIAEPPGIELGANYPPADRERFVTDYPFLPYQIQAAADIFGNMRSVRVSSGARSMIKVVFDATRQLAPAELGVVVSWDQLFDSANRDNEFAEEQYLGSEGLYYLGTADRDVHGTPVVPSRVLKALWLIQQSSRIPRTRQNLARLLIGRLDQDVLQMEVDVASTLEALAARSFVRQDVATGQWRFLSQDEVTVEKIVLRLGEDLRQKEVRDEITALYSKQLLSLLPGRLTAGNSSTSFEYGVFLNDTPLKNELAPVQLRVALAGADAAQRILEQSAHNLEEPLVSWVLPVDDRLAQRLRRALAIERLERDEEFSRVATQRTRLEAEKLRLESDELRVACTAEASRAFNGGTLYWAGQTLPAEAAAATGGGRRGQAAPTLKSRVEEALRDRIALQYDRFSDGDRPFNAGNVERLLTAPTRDRAALDAALGLFDDQGHVYGTNVLAEELSLYLRASTRTSGADIVEHFRQPPYGWPADLLRYVAAALFLDGKLLATDRAGKLFDDPRAALARALFGTAVFRTTRFNVEEDPLTPEEVSAARRLFSDLGRPPEEGSEVALREAALKVLGDLKDHLAVLQRAKDIDLPFGPAYDGLAAVAAELAAPGSRTKQIRAFLAHGAVLRQGTAALQRLEEFGRLGGFAQYRRSQQLLQAALAAGLDSDAQGGEQLRDAAEQTAAIRQQRRVLDDWDGAYKTYRLKVLDSFRATYQPLREELHRRVAAARAVIEQSPEYAALKLMDRTTIRTAYLSQGKPLAEVSLPAQWGEQDLLTANADYSIGHMRAALAALDNQVREAQAAIIALLTREQDDGKSRPPRIVGWRPADAFAHQRFTTPEEVATVFDKEKERLMELCRQGNTVQVL
jgi:hypothetical protein